MAGAEAVWAAHLSSYQAQSSGAPGSTHIPRPGDWTCPRCKPKVIVFASKDECFKCKTPKSMVGVPEEVGIKFGIRGDNLLQLRHEGGSASAKKIRNFKQDFEGIFWEVFGKCYVDFSINPNQKVRDITMNIATGDLWDVMAVGLGIQDLVDPNSWEVLGQYPPSLDDDLMQLALAIKSKSKGSLVLLGGPASFWERPPRFDSFMSRAANTLRKAGVQVVPGESAAHLFEQMTLANDQFHFSNIDDQKAKFVQTFALWLQAASDPTWGLAVEEEGRGRSRSPRRNPVAGWSNQVSQPQVVAPRPW